MLQIELAFYWICSLRITLKSPDDLTLISPSTYRLSKLISECQASEIEFDIKLISNKSGIMFANPECMTEIIFLFF